MVYEAEIRIRRGDPDVLAADFKAVTALLERRRLERRAPPKPAVGGRRLRLVENDA
jgi:hypothetical protein